MLRPHKLVAVQGSWGISMMLFACRGAIHRARMHIRRGVWPYAPTARRRSNEIRSNNHDNSNRGPPYDTCTRRH